MWRDFPRGSPRPRAAAPSPTRARLRALLAARRPDRPALHARGGARDDAAAAPSGSQSSARCWWDTPPALPWRSSTPATRAGAVAGVVAMAPLVHVEPSNVEAIARARRLGDHRLALRLARHHDDGRRDRPQQRVPARPVAARWASSACSASRWRRSTAAPAGLSRALRRDGGDQPRLGLGRPVLRRALQPLRQPDPPQRHRGAEARYLPKLISGEHVGALAMSEPGAGSDVSR
jgi:hypothetical protein